MPEEIKINLPPKITGENAAEVEKDILAQIPVEFSGEVVLEAKGLEYISSSGLRVLLKLAKKNPQRVRMVNVSAEAEDVLKMTGLNQMVSVERRLKSISVDGCKFLGSGQNGSVYRLDSDTIVKVYSKKGIPLEKAYNEQRNARTALVSGVPTAISPGLVQVDGSPGILYELIDAKTIKEYIAENPNKLEDIITREAELLKEIHSIELEAGTFPSMEATYRQRTDSLAGMLSAEEIRLMHLAIDALEPRNTYVHGDCHLGNIMVQGDELLFIDMADSSLGHPMYDIACSYMYSVGMAKIYPEYVSKRFPGWTNEQVHSFWEILRRSYFGTDDPEELNEIESMMDFYNYLRWLSYLRRVPLSDEMKQRCIDMARQEFFPVAEERIEGFKSRLAAMK